VLGANGIVSTKAIMDTNIRSVKAGNQGRRYRRRSLELKRQIVEQTLVPGASVAHIAREHGVNANQVFGWRKLYREGLLGDDAKLLPVTVIEQTRPTVAAPAATAGTTLGRLWLESPKGCLSIDGQPDPAALRLVLEHLLG
jgi:transposase